MMKQTLIMRLLFAFIVLCTVLQASIALGSYFDPNDPYALMYDSNQRLAERIEEMPYFEMSEQINNPDSTLLNRINKDKDEEASASDIETADALTPDMENTADVTPDGAMMDMDKREEIKHDILNLAKEGNIKEISRMDEVPEEVLDQIKQADKKVKEDRYIIKYRTGGGGDIPSLITENMRDIDVHSERDGEMEILVLDEKVNPAELADVLKEAGADEEIKYIQPDFKVYYASTEDNESIKLELDFLTDETEDSAQEIQPNDQEGEGAGTDSGSKETGGTDDSENTEETTPGDTTTEEETSELTTGEEISAEELHKDVIPTEAIVAIIDTGVDYTHPGLEDNIWNNAWEIVDDGIDNDGNGYIDDINGWNFYDDDNQIYDSDYPIQSAHGTHVAGIIVDVAKDYNVKVMPIKVFGDNGAYTSDILDAINYAEANGAKIVNCSFGSMDNNLALKEAMEDSDVLFVCAVGNARSDLEETPIYPACFGLDNIISVTSTNKDGGLSYYSNYSNQLADVAAQGRDVRSTLPEGEYGKQSGTSMAAAQVSGVAAAVLSVDNGLDGDELKDRLINTAAILSNLQDMVVDGRQIDLDHAVLGEEQTEILENDPEDDFNVNGYSPTQDKLYELYTDSGDVIQVVAGVDYTLVLKENGTVWAWGDNWFGQCGNGTTSYSETLTQVLGLTDVVQITAGVSHSLAVKSDGTVWSWGYNNYGQLGDGSTTSRTTPVQVSGLTDVEQIEAGDSFSLAVKSDGTVYAWGYNYYGQLGDGTTTTKTTPTQASNITNVLQVAAGSSHSLALKSDGTVWAWGSNSRGQLGDGTTTTKTTPTQASNITNVLQMAAGSSHSLALKSDGTVWAWGYNNYGQLGDGTTVEKTIPVQISSINDAMQIAVGGYHSLALKDDGTVWAWGLNSSGQLGDGTTVNKTTPVQISGLLDVIQVSSGGSNSIALKGDGSVTVWGSNRYGQLGDGSIVYSDTLVQLSSLTGVEQVAAGYYHSLVLKNDGTVWAWGYNDYGRLGDGTTTNRNTPVQVSGLTDVMQITAGKNHSLALKENGTVWAWGYNNKGQLGDGTTTNRTAPVQVSGLTNVTQIAVGDDYSLALKGDGTVWAWGNNSYGQLGVFLEDENNTTMPVQVISLSNIIQIIAGEIHSQALKGNGTIYAWGDNDDGEIGDGTYRTRYTPVQVINLTNVTQIAAGRVHSMAFRADGTVWAWGNNSHYQLGNSFGYNSDTPIQVANLVNVIKIEGGTYYSLALMSDAMAWSWGDNTCGQLGDDTCNDKSTPNEMGYLNGITQISGGWHHTLVRKYEGTVWGCGVNRDYQLGLPYNPISTVPIQPQINLTYGAPPDVTATLTDTQLTLSYGIIGGTIYYEIEIDGVSINNGKNTAYTYPITTPGYRPTYRVRSINESGPGLWSVNTPSSGTIGIITKNNIQATWQSNGNPAGTLYSLVFCQH